VIVQVPECGGHIAAVLHRAGQLPRGSPRLAPFIIDLSTVPVTHHRGP
jgi:hypothetical protein